MSKKDSKPPVKERKSGKRAEREKGNLRARERSFIKQRTAILRPHDEPAAVAGTRPRPEREDAAGQQDTARPGELERQKVIAQYRRRQQKREAAPDASTGEERTAHHTASPGPKRPTR